MTQFVENNRLTPQGSQLIRLIDRHIAAKTGMSEELRHYAAAVYRTRLMKPTQWLEQFPDKATALWAHFNLQLDEDNSDTPPQFGTQPWIISNPRNN